MPAAVLDDIALEIFERLGYRPTPEQERILAAWERFLAIAGGERAGKSLVVEKLLLNRYFSVPPESERPLYWFVGADYERTRAEFEYAVQDFTRLGLVLPSRGVTGRIDPGAIRLSDGTVIKTKSAKDPQQLAVEAPDGIVICEASQVDLETYHKCSYRVAEKRGWVAMAGTFERGSPWYPQLCTAWAGGHDGRRSFRLPTTSNTALFPEGENDPEILRMKRESSDEFYMERILGIPRPPRGLVFDEFRADIHVQEVEFDPYEPVWIAVDPGYAGAHAVLAIQVQSGDKRFLGDGSWVLGREPTPTTQNPTPATQHPSPPRPVVFDEVYERNLVTEEIIDILKQRRWWGAVQGGVIDVAGYQHQAQAPVAQVYLSRAGVYLGAHRVKNVNDLDERLKTFLKVNPLTGQPGVLVSPRCQGLLSEMGVAPSPLDGQMAPYSWRTDSSGSPVGHAPLNALNHSIRALEYWLVDHYGYSRPQREKLLVGRY